MSMREWLAARRLATGRALLRQRVAPPPPWAYAVIALLRELTVQAIVANRRRQTMVEQQARIIELLEGARPIAPVALPARAGGGKLAEAVAALEQQPDLAALSVRELGAALGVSHETARRALHAVKSSN